MKWQVTAVGSLAAVLACTSGGIDQGNPEGTAEQKLAVPTASRPRGVLGIKKIHVAKPQQTAPTNANLTYYGGNLVNHATYTNVFWGSYWSTNATGQSERTYLDNFMKTVGPAPDFASVLTQYAQSGQPISTGVYQGDTQITTEPGAKIDDSAIQTTIQSWINAGLVPAPSLDQVYVLSFPPSTQVTMGTDASCTNFCGYHGTIKTSSGSGGLIRYIVSPYPSCAGCQFESTVLDSSTVVLSHEMSETITDPDVGLATSTLGPPLGWYDQTNGEIGDICAGDPNASLLGFKVQTEWSNADKACVASRSVAPNPDFSVSVAPPSQTVTQGNSTTYNVVATPANGFSGSIAWSASGLPSGATSSFSGTGNSVKLQVSAGASTAAGSYTLTVTGASGSLSHSATATLVVTAAAQADFAISASPASVSVVAGKSGQSTVSISGSGGFNSGVTLSASGLPSGVTAAFSPASVTGSGSSKLTLSVSAGAAAGTSSITVTGTAGALTHDASVSLTVTPAAQPDFSVTVAPASASIAAGSSSHATLSVGASNGFSAAVALSASGAPSGVTVSFGSASVKGSGSSDVAIAVDASAAAGDYSLTFTGQSGSVSHGASFSLTVTSSAPPTTGVVFSDDAEHGNIGWTIYEENPKHPVWSIEESAASHSGTHRWRSNKGRNYPNNAANFMISPAFSLEGASSATLAFVYKFETEYYYDNFYVWASGDDGATWKEIASGSGTSQGWNRWAPEASLDLSDFAGASKVRIAFSLQSDASVTDWGAALDDISVTAQ